MRLERMSSLYHEEKRGPGDFPGPRALRLRGLEVVADPRSDRGDVVQVSVRTVEWIVSTVNTRAVDRGGLRQRCGRRQRRLERVADPHVTTNQVERQPGRESPGDAGIEFRAHILAPVFRDGAADFARDDGASAG